MRDLLVLVVVAGACSSPVTKPAVQEPEGTPSEPEEVTRTWIVIEHVLVKGAPITHEDARAFHGRTIDVGETGFMSPWQGSCEDASRTSRARELKGVMIEFGVQPPDRPQIVKFGIGPDVTEFRMTCNDRRKPPPLTLYTGNEKAMSCFGGACYLMNKF